MYPEEINNEIIDLLRSKNLRVTIHRVNILNVLHATPIELTAMEIERKLLGKKKINISAVYHVLKEFEKADLIQRYKEGDSQATFSLKKNDDTIRFVCKVCKKTFPFDQTKEPKFLDLVQQIEILAKTHKFKINSFALNIDAICENCLTQSVQH